MIALLLLQLFSLARPTGAAQGPSPAELARQIQQHYDRVKDFTATFTQTYDSGVLKKKTTEHGTVQIKRPGRMRWDYTSPEKKEFVSDGVKIYSYIPADKQVVVSPMPTDNATTTVLFLSGKGDLTRDFKVSLAAGAGPDEWAIRLDPMQQQRDFDWLVLIVGRQTLQIHTLVAGDRDGGHSTFAFEHYRENVGLPDSVFAFKIPRGVDVSGG